MSSRRLERRIALRYLRSRSSGVASLNTIISIGGVAVGVMALIVVLGVMNGLRDDLRERILVGAPHLRVLTYGAGLRIDDWQDALDVIREVPEVVAAAPEVLTESIITTGADYATAVNVLGIEPDTGHMSVTTFPQSITKGDLSFRTSSDTVQGGLIIGERLANRINAWPGDVVLLVPPTAARYNRALGAPTVSFWRFEITGTFNTGMY
ncbi:MAG TPA: ABC transporter permease, partial [Gemmatimonadales bacterium]|nr:ABC transporter permease [Gemmatimonadales bacterium]